MFSSQANIQCQVPSVSFIHDYFVPSIMSGTEEKMTSKRSFWPWPWLSLLEHHPLDLRVANSIPAQGICEKLPIGFSSSLSLSLKAMKQCPQMRIKKREVSVFLELMA